MTSRKQKDEEISLPKLDKTPSHAPSLVLIRPSTSTHPHPYTSPTSPTSPTASGSIQQREYTSCSAASRKSLARDEEVDLWQGVGVVARSEVG